MLSPCHSMSSFTDASSSSATPSAIHHSARFNDSEKNDSTDNSTGVLQLHVPQEHTFEDDMSRDNPSIVTDGRVRELESRLSVSNRVAEFTKQRLLQSEQERHANSYQLNELKLELIRAQEQLKAKDETIAIFAAQYDQRTLRLDEMVDQMSNVHSQLGENWKDTLATHQAELKRSDEEKKLLARKIEKMESKYGKLEEEADVMQKRAFTAEGTVQLIEAKLKSSVSQFELKWEESQKSNQFLERKVAQIENQGADKECKYKEREQQLESELSEWRKKAVNLEGNLDQEVPRYNTRIEELQGRLKLVLEESGRLRVSLSQTERARDDLATFSHQNENEIMKLRSRIHDKDKKMQSEREERDKYMHRMEELHKRLLEAESRLHASNRMNDFYKNKLVTFEEEKAVRVPLVAKNAVLQKKLDKKERELHDTAAQCFAQAERIVSLEVEINTTRGSHEEAVEALKATVSTLQTEQTALLEEIAHLRARLDPTEKNNRSMRNTIIDLESQLSASLKETNSVQCMLDEYEEIKKKADSETDEQFKEFEAKLEDCRSKADLLGFQLAESEADANGKISELESLLETYRLQVTSLEDDIASLHEQKILSDATHSDHVHHLEHQLRETRDEVTALKHGALIAAADAADEHHTLRMSVAKLQSRYAECHSELEITKSNLGQTEANLTSIRTDSSREIDDLQNTLSSDKDIINELRFNISQSELISRNLQAHVDELQSRLADSGCVAKTLTDQLVEIRKTAQEQILSLESKLQVSNQQLAETQYHLDEANKESMAKTQQISDFDSQLPAINRKVFYLEAEVNHAKDEVLLFQNILKTKTDDFQSKLTMERERFDTLKAEASQTSDKTSELRSVMGKLELSLAEKSSALDAAHTKVTNQEMQIGDIISHIAELKSQLFESEKEIDALRAKLTRAERKFESEKAKTHHRHLESFTNDYEKEVATLREKIAMLEEDKLRNMEHVRLIESNFL